MKLEKIAILAIAFYIIVSSIIITQDNEKIQSQKKQITNLKDSTLIYKRQLKEVRTSYRNHIKNCAFISRESIKKRNGRYIILYANNNLNRK